MWNNFYLLLTKLHTKMECGILFNFQPLALTKHTPIINRRNKMSNEEILKEYGITERTSHHNYDYLYKSILSAMQQAQEEAVKVALEMAADTLSDNDCVMDSLTIRCNSIISLHSQVMDKLNNK